MIPVVCGGQGMLRVCFLMGERVQLHRLMGKGSQFGVTVALQCVVRADS